MKYRLKLVAAGLPWRPLRGIRWSYNKYWRGGIVRLGGEVSGGVVEVGGGGIRVRGVG